MCAEVPDGFTYMKTDGNVQNETAMIELSGQRNTLKKTTGKENAGA